MPASRDITDALECVLSVFFSNVRHHTRAAFLLCDEFVEVACKAKLKTVHRNMGHIGFFDLLKHAVVNLDPNTSPLGASLLRNHQTRNNMQHANAAATVDDQHCADGIIDAISALEHCFPGSWADLTDNLKVALRVVQLHSSQGNNRQRADFEEAMSKRKWNSPPKQATTKLIPVAVGSRPHWGHVIMSNNVVMTEILDSVGIP
jgi:hypothetical protein